MKNSDCSHCNKLEADLATLRAQAQTQQEAGFEKLADVLTDVELPVCAEHVDAVFVCPECFTRDVLEAQDPAIRQPWQPISTAPKDGREILCTWVYTFTDGRQQWCNVMHVVSWFKDWHGEAHGAWVLDGDFNVHFEPDEIHETPPVKAGEPTHWAPLPAPPVVRAPQDQP